MVHVLNHSTLHAFIREHPWSVLFASLSERLEFSSKVAEHFARNYGNRIACANVPLFGPAGAGWFGAFLGRYPLRGPTCDGRYYLVCDGRPVAAHDGLASNAASTSLVAATFVSAASGMDFFEAINMADQRQREQGAALLIACFEEKLSRRPPPTATQPENEEDDFALLEIPKRATLKQAEAAFRKLMADFHPDNVRRAGKLRDLAEQRAKALSAAILRFREGKPRGGR